MVLRFSAFLISTSSGSQSETASLLRAVMLCSGFPFSVTCKVVAIRFNRNIRNSFLLRQGLATKTPAPIANGDRDRRPRPRQRSTGHHPRAAAQRALASRLRNSTCSLGRRVKPPFWAQTVGRGPRCRHEFAREQSGACHMRRSRL